MFLNFFGLPRSAALVGGLVLALLVLPTIIIASRAALQRRSAIDPEAALGVGASHQQAVFHHVLPLAMPGIMTGTIIGMAHALGETAPLLMIGMVAFIVDIPQRHHRGGHGAAGADLLWSDLPELAFRAKTAAAIIVLLVFLFVHECSRHSVAQALRASLVERTLWTPHVTHEPQTVLTPRRPAHPATSVRSRSRRAMSMSIMATSRRIQDLSIDIPDRAVSAFIGPSGCGKSTFLRSHQPDERYDPDRARDRQDHASTGRTSTTATRRGAAAGPRRHGVPEAQSVSQIDLRECRLWAAHSWAGPHRKPSLRRSS